MPESCECLRIGNQFRNLQGQARKYYRHSLRLLENTYMLAAEAQGGGAGGDVGVWGYYTFVG